MKRISEKLKSTRGASLLFALLIFMLCVLVGVSSLTAASANAGRYTHASSDQQKYLSTASAVNLLRGELGDKEFTATAVFTKTLTWTKTPVYVDVGGNMQLVGYNYEEKIEYKLEFPETQFGGDGDGDANKLIGVLMKEYCEKMFKSTVVPGEWYTLAKDTAPAVPDVPDDQTLTLNGSTDELKEQLGEAKATVSTNDNYAMTVAVGMGDDAGYYSTSIYLPAQKHEETSETVTRSGNEYSGQEITETTLTFKIEWPDDDVIVVRGTIGG